ncbi:hypothetical protein Thiowin_02723 [Thiorhodovibrio winogradskyi]|uniref:Uncharacterized protein n=1 Tax=Thiorhodovibrio winogradskyi TaxID=77007 RepID=A0ABZ0SBK4_9GAMM
MAIIPKSSGTNSLAKMRVLINPSDLCATLPVMANAEATVFFLTLDKVIYSYKCLSYFKSGVRLLCFELNRFPFIRLNRLRVKTLLTLVLALALALALNKLGYTHFRRSQSPD